MGSHSVASVAAWAVRPISVRTQTLALQMTTHIITQNVHHLTPEKKSELVESMQDRGVFAACLQETWMQGNQQWSTLDGYVFINPPTRRSTKAMVWLLFYPRKL